MPAMEKEFLKLAILSRIEYHEIPSEWQLQRKESTLSDQLRSELKRIYQMESGQELIERAQEKAVDFLETQTKNSYKNF
jgi:hypothetical protein